MERLSGPVVVEEDPTHFLVGIHYNDRHLARDIPGRTWDGGKRRWTWSKSKENYNNLVNTFKEIATRFEISEKNLDKAAEPRGIISEDTIEDNYNDWHFNDTTEFYIQAKQLQNIEDKIDILIEAERAKTLNAQDAPGDPELNLNAEISGNESDPERNDPANEIFNFACSDKRFNELIATRGANQSPVQRIHNAIRDEILAFKEISQNEIDEVLKRKFAREEREFRPSRHIGLLQLIWLAQEEKYYSTNKNGELDIFQMLHMFNSTRNILEKQVEVDEETTRFHTLLCLSLGRLIWSRISVCGLTE